MKLFDMIFLWVLLLLLAFAMISCGTSREVQIRGFERLFITDIASDNIAPTDGIQAQGEANLYGGGMFQQGGILSASKIIIEGATGSTISIERGGSGNHGSNTSEYLERVFIPTSHPFGNVIIDEKSSKREHVEN